MSCVSRWSNQGTVDRYWVEVQRTVKSDSELRQKEQPGLCDNPHLAIFLHVGRELIDVADGKIVMFLGKWDWTSDQIELTDDNEYLTTFEKKKPWDVRWCCSLISWLEISW